MNSTVELICTSRVEWPDSCAIIAIESDVNGWCAAFCLGLRGVPIPGAIFDDVLRCCIIDKVEHIALIDVYRAYEEAGSSHVDLGSFRDRSFIINCTGGEYSGQQTTYEKAYKYFFIHWCSFRSEL